jgi:hypothetical protein
MHSHGWWKRPAEQAALKCCRRLLACGVLLGLLALAAGVAISERLHRDDSAAHHNEPAAVAAMVDGQSGGGNLVPRY